MQRIFSNSSFTNEQIHCPECSWTGKAIETKQEHLFLTDALELHCPSCDKYLGFVDQDQEKE